MNKQVSVFVTHHDKTESRSGIGIMRFPPDEFAEAGSTARILNKNKRNFICVHETYCVHAKKQDTKTQSLERTYMVLDSAYILGSVTVSL